jgi:hypothetical protein
VLHLQQQVPWHVMCSNDGRTMHCWLHSCKASDAGHSSRQEGCSLAPLTSTFAVCMRHVAADYEA